MVRFLPGDGIRLTCRITRASDGALIDIGALTLILLHAPSGAEERHTLSAGQVTRLSQGLYECRIVAAASGRYRYRWEAGNGLAAAAEGTFIVQRSRVLI